MNDEMMEYRCKVCKCIFAIDLESVIKAEKEGRYIACPLGHRNIGRADNYKRLMEERKAVDLI